MISPFEVESKELEEKIHHKQLARQSEQEIDKMLRPAWNEKERSRTFRIYDDVRKQDIKKLVYGYRQQGWACRPNRDSTLLVFQNPRKIKCGFFSKLIPYWFLLPWESSEELFWDSFI